MQMLHVKEKEEEEIMKLYHSLCEDNQHLKLAALEGDNQLQNQQYQIQSLEEAVQRAQAQIKLAAEENRQLASDLKVFHPTCVSSCILSKSAVLKSSCLVCL
jgi:chromosome segregation ATPase